MSSELLNQLLEGRSLERSQARAMLNAMMDGQTSPELSAALLTALRMKGESTEELSAFTELMRERCQQVPVTAGTDLIDTCGTGGDGSGSFNVSTATAFVVAGMGLRVAKHGNRSVSSRCGSADVLEELGVNIELDPQGMARCIDECGIGFLYAPRLHPAMKQIAPVRRALGIRTCFNMLGPLTNPAGASRQLVGCFSREAAQRMAAVLARLGGSQAILVSSHDGLDEISISDSTSMFVVSDRQFSEMTIEPENIGLRRRERSEISGGDAAQNAQIIRRVLAGEEGAARDIVLANAAACAVLGNLATELSRGVELAVESIDSGRAAQALAQLIALSNSPEVVA